MNKRIGGVQIAGIAVGSAASYDRTAVIEATFTQVDNDARGGLLSLRMELVVVRNLY